MSTVRLPMWTSLSGWGNGNGRSMTALMTLKMAVFAPMPSASVNSATAVNPGLRASMRMPYFTSCQMVCTVVSVSPVS